MTFRRWCALGLVAASLAACGRKAPSPPQPIIAIAPKGSTHEFWRLIRAGASQEAARLGVYLAWPNAVPEGNLQAQWDIVAQARALAAQRGAPLAVAISPFERRAWIPPVADLQDAGHPVVVFDSELDGDDYVGFVGTDNKAAGRAAGHYLARALGERGNVAMLRLNPLSDATNERERAFLDAIATHPEIRVVSAERYAGSLVESAYSQAHGLLDEMERRGITLDGVFASNESTTVGLFRALEDRGLTSQIKLVGFDHTAGLVNAMWKRELTALVVQDPVAIGRRIVSLAVDALGRFGSLAPLRKTDPRAYRTRLREAFPATNYAEFMVVDRGDLERGLQLSERIGLDNPQTLAIEPERLQSAPGDPASVRAARILRILYPDRTIVHQPAP